MGNKKNQRGLWYAWEPCLKRIVAHVFGDRSRKTLDKLLALLSPLILGFIVRMIMLCMTASQRKNT
ncbi:hypothetical protein XBFFL1_620001 [Xenorhabdus bovienii str. feltiae Florida]|nr:hypothetical protein XBFFR1_1470001 [Xenorhabdus bovienii str. feltiae France]CDG94463.1 hypothetical protein XBFFL1_620001 [Xenorhabdus bovienii str. feltiae Florida]